MDARSLEPQQIAGLMLDDMEGPGGWMCAHVSCLLGRGDCTIVGLRKLLPAARNHGTEHDDEADVEHLSGGIRREMRLRCNDAMPVVRRRHIRRALVSHVGGPLHHRPPLEDPANA